MNRRRPRPLAIHGIAIRSEQVESVARSIRALLDLPVLRRSRRELVLGHGPELFIVVRRATPRHPEGIEELHIAVDEATTLPPSARADPLGGDSRTRALGKKLSLTVRQFRRPPGKAWRRKRRPV